MKNQEQQSSQQIAPNTVAAILSQAPSPLATHISIPIGAVNNPEASALYAKSLQQVEPEYTNNTGTNHHVSPINSSLANLTFGAPQIDLTITSGSAAASGLHEFNPRHFRDQDSTFKCALALAARHRNNATPIFCFLTEDQSSLITWLTSNGASSLNIAKEDLVFVTAKHSDDLLWAMEETMHTQKGATIVAHFTLLDNLSAQRLAFTAKTNELPCLIVCNHPIEGPKHTNSAWSVQALQSESQTSDESLPSIALSLTHTKGDMAGENWTLKWSPKQGRFTATLSDRNPAKTTTLH